MLLQPHDCQIGAKLPIIVKIGNNREFCFPIQFPIIANIGNRQAFWGLAPFATEWRKGAF